MLDYTKSFIETQFPVSKISKESYKERKAGASQTLTGLGKWWGRKPLILVRATLLGTLMPVSDDPIKDREIFLKILTMDDEGLFKRKTKSISTKDVYKLSNRIEKEKFFTVDSCDEKPKYESGLDKEAKGFLQKLIFNRLSYDRKLKYCERPENYELIDNESWSEINNHLGTTATNLQELTEQLGINRFGHRLKVGDAFAGGGSIPFESARMGADVYASDLNPIATLLNWTALNIASTSKEEIEELNEFQDKIYEAVDKQIIEWKIEKNEFGHRADAYLYCNETICPECGYRVPLAPSWIIGKKTKTVALLKDNGADGYNIEVVMDANNEQFSEAEKLITFKKGKLVCPNCTQVTPISSIRGDKKDGNKKSIYGLRLWEKNEYIPRLDDVFQERLYVIRYVGDKGRYYTTPSKMDLDREQKVINILSEKFSNWQEKGYIPSSLIEPGYNTTQPIREHGWKYWHQLFNPRQLLITGLLIKLVNEMAVSKKEVGIGLLGINKCVNWNSKLSIWHTDDTHNSEQMFYNQAFNTLFNYCCRAFIPLKNIWQVKTKGIKSSCIDHEIDLIDARTISKEADIWITDPPYSDAVNYHELSELFIAWNNGLLTKNFTGWYADSKRALAIKDIGKTFNDSMIDVYKNLANHMPDNGYQVVMFTHQDVKVWSELSMILWSAGLRVVSAWNIATETESGGLKAGGNYVKGTVLLTLKKQTSNEIAFQDELYDEIKYEVKHIIDSMKNIDDKDDPDFTDADYLLASYASSLKVLTAYKEIDGIDVEYWLTQPRNSKEENPVEMLINKAVRIAYDYLIPEGFDTSLWKDLKPEERFYIRGLEVEMSGVAKISSYQELARGFGVNDYKDMFASFKANSARLKTPSEFKMAFLNGDGFGSTLLRHLFVAIYETTENKSTVEGRGYLKNVFQKDNQYWYKKPLMIELLSFIANLEYVDHMKHWHEHAYSAKILKEALKNEGV
ncbi:DUF1156 domain-containing protein [Clostridiaceae bacterium HSG29]|nr:DUF1156 domain-containing protein [Clostridiaceae bacterium HSG29]